MPRLPLALGVSVFALSIHVSSQPASPDIVGSIPFVDARQIFEVLRDDLLPDALKGRTPLELEGMWTGWVATRDSAIRERVAQGDEDSVINLLLFGTTFTKRPRPTEANPSAGRAAAPAG